MTQQLGIRELAERAKKEGAIDLAQGVIDTDLPTPLVNALHQVPIQKISRYDNKRGVPAYREALVNYLGSRGWNIEVDNVMSVAGAMAGITSSLLTDLKPGAKVLLPEPFYIAHEILLNALGFEIVFLPAKIGEQLDWDDVIDKMEDVDGVIITSPANPTGQTASLETLKKLSEAARDKNCLLVLDEMYREFIWDNPPKDDADYQKMDWSKTVLVRSWSKAFAIPGWRVGFAVTSPERIEEMAVRHDALYIGGSTVSQHVLAEVLQNNLPELNQYVVELREMLLRNKAVLEEAFTKYGFIPQPVPATYYMLMKHDRPTDMAVVEELIAKKIVTTPATIFFHDRSKETGFLRIHFAAKEEAARKVAEILTK
jgi:aspartate/methionine/tyrosine aminotransferase